MKIDLSKIQVVWFTARQLALLTQLAQAVGVMLIGGGLVTSEAWATYSGGVLSILSILVAFRDGGANDANTAAMQSAVGATPDAKPAAQSVSAAIISTTTP